MTHLDPTHLTTLLQGPEPVLVDFSATWCGPCKIMKPIVTDLATTYAGKAHVAVVDIDEQPGLASQYAVTAVPTFVLFKDGQEVDRLTGAVPRPILESRLNQFV